MKPYILFALLLSLASIPAFASDPDCTTGDTTTATTETYQWTTETPAWLKGATITVKLANGKESTVSAEKFKVVPRKQQFLTKVLTKETKISCTTEGRRHHRVSVLGGHGAQAGLDTDSSNAPSETTVSSKVGAVGGLQYQYLLPILDDRFSIGGQAQTNKTFSLSVGVDF